jgi:hypothetical protein
MYTPTVGLMLAARIEGDTLPRNALYVQAVLQGDRAVS